MVEASTLTSRDNGSRQAPQNLPSRKPRRGETNVGQLERLGSIIGGAALTLFGLKRRSLGGVALSLVGSSLVYRGLTGHCYCYEALGINTAGQGETAQPGVHIEKSITILKSPEEIYRFWRRFENLPYFMHHLESVQAIDDRRSHWVATIPAGGKMEWDAEITEDRGNELIAWRSLEGARVPNNGRVQFRRAPGGRGTEVHVTLNYAPPLGKVGATLAKLFGQEPGQYAQEDLRRLKSFMEAGEMPTTEGQVSGRMPMASPRPARRRQPPWPDQAAQDVVTEASMESFPASDPPAWTFRKEGG